MSPFVIAVVAVVGAVAGILLAGPRLLKRYFTGRVAAEIRQAHDLTVEETDPLLDGLDPAQPTLVYFTADWCAPCRTTQTPIIEQLAGELEGLQVRKVDVDEHQADARRWGVVSLPRTFVLRPGHAVHATNVGVAALHTLREQITAARSATGGSVEVAVDEALNPTDGLKVKRRPQPTE